MNQQKRETILAAFSNNPVIDTDIIALYFQHQGSPGKRASEYLHALEQEKLIEGQRRAIGESKVWRLTKKGRNLTGVDARPAPLTGMKVNHYIGIARAWHALTQRGQLLKWRVELREPFMIGNKKHTYCPDAFCVIKLKEGTRAFLIEVQQSPLTSTRWGEKWAVASAFFESPALKDASFQIVPNHTIKPKIIVISSQQPDTIQAGSKLPLIITPDIKKAALI